MLKRVIFLISICLMDGAFLFADPVSVSIKSDTVQKMKLMIAVIKPTPQLLAVQELLKEMLEQSKAQQRGFSIILETFQAQPSRKTIKSYAQKNMGLAFFLSSSNGKTIEWRMYDTQNSSMIKGKRFSIEDYSPRTIAEYIADQLWPLLTGQNGFFSTRIAYCKHIRTAKKMQKHIYVTQPYRDILSSDDQAVLLVDHANAFAPRWNYDAHNPLILYSEIAKANVRLMSVSLDKKRKLVANLEGMTTHASFSKDGTKVVYCSADGSLYGNSNIFLYQIDLQTGKPSVQQITNNQANNISPILCHNGDIIFCTDAGSKNPYICCYHADTGLIAKITNEGYASSPAYCEQTKMIAYSRNCNGVMQIFLYDCIAKAHTQLTFDNAHKEQSSWSPCGNYLAFTQDTGKTTRIAVHHIITGERIFLTSATERCSYPCWSPAYDKPMIV